MAQRKITRRGRAQMAGGTHNLQLVEQRPPPPYSIPGFAEVLGIRPSTVRKKLARREVTFFKIGRRTLIPFSEVARLIAANTIPALPVGQR
jgi:excisionase family DNA binding protein